MSSAATLRLRPGRIDALVIGASAGGIEVLSQLLPALAAGSRLSVFVVLHLPRERPSLLADIFTPKCALQVREADDKEPVQSGTVYFAPPDYHLMLDDGPQIALSSDEPEHHSRPSIDVLFESAADVYGRHLAAVLLSGSNDDGAAGLLRVQRAGGLTLVQEPTSARMAAMPQAGLALCRPDHVLAPPAMAELFRMLSTGDLP